MEIIPTNDNIIVKPIKAKTETDSGISLLKSNENNRGQVISVGPGTKEEKMEVAIGDTIIFKRSSSVNVTIDGDECFIIKQYEVLAIIKE